jgi:hypothetical protein
MYDEANRSLKKVQINNILTAVFHSSFPLIPIANSLSSF